MVSMFGNGIKVFFLPLALVTVKSAHDQKSLFNGD